MKDNYKEMCTMHIQAVDRSMRLAHAYVPDQPYIALFPLDEALKKGTIFPNLYMPYMPAKKAKHKREE